MLQETNLVIFSAAAVLAYLIWRLLRDYVLPSPFRTLPGPPSDSVMFGNMQQFGERDAWGFWKNLAEKYGPAARFHGFFGASSLFIYDTKALHHILIKDQDKFSKGENMHAFGDVIFGPGLLFTEGERHRKQRKMLNPVFSVSHMRHFTPVFHGIANKLKEAIRQRVGGVPKEIDVHEWIGRTALELVGQGGLGHSFDPLITDSQDKFTGAIKSFSASLSDIGHLLVFLPFITKLGPGWFRRMVLDALPGRKMQEVKYIIDTAHAGCRKIFEDKKAALKSGDQEALLNIGEGKDVMSILLKANVMASPEDRLPEEELMAQMMTFVVAGVDTTSNATSRVLHLISEKQDVQEKLRTEVREAYEQYGEDISFEEIMALPFLDAVCRETLRMYAPLNSILREAMEDLVLPLSEPIRGTDGASISELIVPKGTHVICGLRACNMNEAVWGEDAEEWKPERWLAPLPSTVDGARIPSIYSNLMTFISGVHACIGFKFSQLEMKIVLAKLLANFKFERSETPIVWNFAGVSFPAKSHDSVRPEMYLKVSIAE